MSSSTSEILLGIGAIILLLIILGLVIGLVIFYFGCWIKKPKSSLYGIMSDIFYTLVICLGAYIIAENADNENYNEFRFVMLIFIICFPFIHLVSHMVGRCPNCYAHRILTRHINTKAVGERQYAAPSTRIIRNYDERGIYTGETRESVDEIRTRTIFEHTRECKDCGHSWSKQNEKKNHWE